MHVRERKINATAFIAILAAAWASVVPARVRAADTPGGGGDTAYPLDPSGETVIPETGKPARFFRLKATEL